MVKNLKIKIAAIASAAVLAGTGAGLVSASAATTAPPAGNLYGCITSTRTIANAYTTEKNFVAFLNLHGGKCPSGFPFTVKSGQVAPTPTPSPTSATPTPTPTGAPKYEMTTLDRATTPQLDDPNVSGGPNDGGASVRQEVWNPQPALRKQDTKVWGPGNWTTTVNAAAGNTEVNNYPDVSDTVTTSNNTPQPVSSYHSMVSTYSENMHVNVGTDAEAAYDIWLNDYNNELMIWVDNHGQEPAGTNTGKTITVGGNTYHVWDEPGHGTVSLVLDSNAQSGTTDILGIVKALQGMGIYSATAGFSQVDFGFETPSTGGVDETFAVTGYTLKYS